MKNENVLNGVKTEEDITSEFIVKAKEFAEEMASYVSKDDDDRAIIVMATDGEGAIVASCGKPVPMAALLDKFDEDHPQIVSLRSLRSLAKIIGLTKGNKSDSE